MSHKASAIPAGCFFSPASPIPVSPSKLSPSTSFSRPFNVRNDSGLPGTSPPPSIRTSLPAEEAKDVPTEPMKMPPAITPSTATQHTTSRIDFDDLPATVQRKFLTPAERSRLTTKEPDLCSTSVRDTPVRKPSPTHGLSKRRSRQRSPLNAGTTPRSRKRRSSVARQSVIPLADANWFINLPPAVKRKLFTPAEQELLSARCEKVVVSATDDALNKLERTAPPALSTPSSTESLTTTMTSVRSFKMPDAVQDTFRWLDSEETLDLHLSFANTTLDDGPFGALSTPKTPSPLPISPPKRSLSQRVVTRRRSSPRRASPPPRQHPAVHGAKPKSGPRPSQDSLATAGLPAEMEATFYQDPAARSKLRVLASPRKFDEAVEFGFPSTKPTRPITSDQPKEQKPAETADDGGAHTFFDDGDDASLVEDRTDVSTPDGDFPLTPSEPDGTFRSPHSTAFAKTKPPEWVYVAKPTFGHKYADPVINIGARNREMTLRMTLTRPELRADDEALYGWQTQGKDNLLALEELPPCADELAPAMGPFGGVDGWGSSPKDDGLVKKLWRRVKPGFRKW